MASAVSAESDGDGEAFEDALEFMPSVQGAKVNAEDIAAELGAPENASMEVDLLQSIREAQTALEAFFNNQFEKARRLMEPLADRSIYHALTHSALCYLRAALTMERPDLAVAAEVASRALRVCQRFRRRRLVFRPGDFTDEQCHAELCYAELLLESAVLAFVQDETMVSFLRGGLRVRECHQVYRQCFRLLRKRTWSCEQLCAHFESGARMGIGAFSLFVSLLPPTVLRLLRFIGFSGDRQFGLEQLEAAASVANGLRVPLAQLLLATFHAGQAQMLASRSCGSAQQWLLACRARYPNSAIVLYLEGRISLLQGDRPAGVRALELSAEAAAAEWAQLRLLCDWEMMWAHACRADWPAALRLAERLACGSSWSKATMAYIRACFLYHVRGDGDGGDGGGVGDAGADETDQLRRQLQSMFEQVPKLCQRLAGRTLPLDKFAARRSQRWLEQSGRLTLPALELLLAWNAFHLVETDLLLGRFLPMVQAASDQLDAAAAAGGLQARYPHVDDDRALVLLLKAVCLRYLGQSRAFQAEQCLLEATGHLAGQVQRDRHVTAMAWLELAGLQAESGRPAEARASLDACRGIRGISLEARIHMRAHAMAQLLPRGSAEKLGKKQ